MKRNKLVILVCVAAVMVLIAVKTGNNRMTGSPSERGIKELFPELPVNDITKLVITDANRSVTLERSEDGWHIPEAFGYPASFDKVKSALLNLSQIKGGEPRKLNPAQRANAGLISPLDKANKGPANGVMVQAFTSGESPAASLLIGSDRQNPGNAQIPAGKFISVDGGETALITAQITTSLEGTYPPNWMDTEIVSVDASSITNIRISVAGEKPLELHNDAAGNLTMDDLSRKETLDESKARSVRYVLSYLRFDEVADPSLSDAALGFDKPSVFEAATGKGEIYKLVIGSKVAGSENRYARLSAEFTGTIPPEPEKPEADGKTAAARKELQDAKERVDKVNGHSRWTYILAPSKTGSALSTRKDLVTKKKD